MVRRLPSFGQERAWTLQQLEPWAAAQNISVRLRMRGRLDTVVFESALNEIVRRHETLRTTFTAEDGLPVQVIAPELNLPVPVTDGATALMHERREEEAEMLACQEAERPFDIVIGPSVRARLIRLDSQDHMFLLTMHQLVSDSWSIETFVRELENIYGAFATGQSHHLPELHQQFGDFAEWQRKTLRREMLEQQGRYWRAQLVGMATSLDLPLDRPRPQVRTARRGLSSFLVTSRLVRSLTLLARRQRATLFIALSAALKVLLARYSSQTDISVGTRVSNRTRPEFAPLIGPLANTLVLRTDLSGDPTFREVLGRERAVVMGAYEHQDLPFEELLDLLSPGYDLSQTPLFQVILDLYPPARAPSLPDMACELYDPIGTKAEFDITLRMGHFAGGLRSNLEYAADLFDSGTATQMAAHFCKLLENVAADPDRHINSYQLLSEDERHTVLVKWQTRPQEIPAVSGLEELFRAQANRTPGSLAVQSEDDTLTYGELAERVERVGRFLQSRRAGPEQVIAVCAEPSPAQVVAVLGVLRSGAAFLPLDPAYPEQRLAFMLSDARARLVLAQAHLAESLPNGTPVVTLEEAVAASGPKAVNPVNPGRLAYVIYTSGSTGVPKGVGVTHANLLPLLTWARQLFDFGPRTRTLQTMSFSFDFGIYEILANCLFGGRLHTLSTSYGDPLALAKATMAWKITALHATPSLLEALVRLRQPFPSLEVLHVGGEEFPWRLVRMLRQVLPSSCRVFNGYGPTENSVNSMILEVDPWVEVYHPTRALPIGRASAATRAYVLDEWMELVPVGAPGELYVGGPGLARGYLRRPELTAQRFLPDPFGPPGSRLYRTGDLVRSRPDGIVEFIGRLDNQLKVRGYRIEPGEVETRLEEHPGVRQAVVVAQGEGAERQLVAFVVPFEKVAPSRTQLRRFASTHLPDYMVPTQVISLPALPLTPNGKVDRTALMAFGGR